MTVDQSRRVLVVMAHPDDAEILVGGTLLLLVGAGWRIGIVTVTAGDCGSSTGTDREAVARVRLTEAAAAAKSIGAWFACAGIPDVEVFATPASARAVVEVIREFAPTVVITHSPTDYSRDHEETTRIVRSAAFAAAIRLYRTDCERPAPHLAATPGLYYADPVEGTDHFGGRVYPDFYIDISEVIDPKRTLVAHHASQREWLRQHHGIDEYLQRVTEWAATYGGECGVTHAEGLRQHRGHGFPAEPQLQNGLGRFVKKRRPGALAFRQRV